jgi:hypothetical protein
MSEIQRPGALYRHVAAALRAEGLLDVVHGKGSFVLTIERTVNRDSGGAFTVNDAADWQQADEARVYRTMTTTTTGPCRASYYRATCASSQVGGTVTGTLS